MRKVFIIIITIALNSSFLFAQVTFEKTFGQTLDDHGEYVQQTADNGYIITGFSYDASMSKYCALMIKTDSIGNLMWEKCYDNSQNMVGYCVQETTDGGFIFVGYIADTVTFTGYTDVYVSKLDNMGDTIWSKTFDNDIKDKGMSIRQTIDGGYIIAGFACDSMLYDCDVYLLKINNTGDMQWYKRIGGPDRDQAYCIEQTSDNGFIIVGSTFSYGYGYRDIYLIKTNENGDTLFTKTYGGYNTDNAYSVKQTSDGGFIIIGETISFNSGQHYYDVYLIKTNAGGDTLWTKRYGGEDWTLEVGRSIVQTNDGDYVITGLTESFGALDDNVLVMKVNSTGDLIWMQAYGGNGVEGGTSIQLTNDGGYIIAGSSSSFSSSVDVYLIKINEIGTSDITGNFIQDEIEIFPNPAKNNIYIKIKNKTEIVITNLEGQIIYNKTIQHQNELLSIDISNVPVGLYLIKCINEENSTTEKLIIQ
jgi:hypothetical protein